MINQSKKLLYGLLSLAAVTAISLVGTTTHAQAATKTLTSIPKVLRGYWYSSEDGDSTVTHITSKHIDTKNFNNKNKKQSLLKLKKAKHSKLVLSNKIITNKTFMLVQNGHNNWFTRSIAKSKRYGTGYLTNYYYLRGSKKSPKLSLIYEVSIGGFDKIFKTKNPPKHSMKWSKVSHKYLTSIGFYK